MNYVNTFARWWHSSDHLCTIKCRHLANVYEYFASCIISVFYQIIFNY